MNTTSTGSSGAPGDGPRATVPLSLRVQLAFAFGALAGALAVALSLAIGHYASEIARVEIGRYLSRLAIEYRDKLDAGPAAAAAGVDLAAAARLRDDIESHAPPASPFELLLLQADGTVLLGPPALAGKKVPTLLVARVGAPAAMERWPDGEKYLSGRSASRSRAEAPGAGWVSVARQRRDIAFAPVAELQRAILWAGLALALAGIGVGWLLATRLSRPLEALAAAAGDVVAGKQRAALPMLRNNRELARLSAALRAMLSHLLEHAEKLREVQDSMERRVRERTAELVKTQAQLELEIADTMVARDDVAKAHAQLELALEASQLALWDLDVENDRIFLGPYWSQMLGGEAVETRTTTRELFALVPEEHRARVSQALTDALTGTAHEYRIEHPVRRRDGSVFWIASLGRVVARDADRRATRVVGTNRDITDRIEAQHEVEALALRDALTGLPNKRLLDDRLDVALAAARREHRPLGLLFIDLDGVAPAGSEQPDQAGSALLLELARRARAALRETDTFARVGGHEFVAVLPGAGAGVLALPASRLLKVLSQPVQVDGRSATVAASIGASQSVEGKDEPAILLARADAQMELARRAGRNSIRIDAGPIPADASAPAPNPNHEENKR